MKKIFYKALLILMDYDKIANQCGFQHPAWPRRAAFHDAAMPAPSRYGAQGAILIPLGPLSRLN